MESSKVNLIGPAINGLHATNNQDTPIEKKVTSKKHEIVPFKTFIEFTVLLNPNVKRFIDVLNTKLF
jgi:hypothetical protein